MAAYPGLPARLQNLGFQGRHWNRRSGGWESTSTGRSVRTPLSFAIRFPTTLQHHFLAPCDHAAHSAFCREFSVNRMDDPRLFNTLQKECDCINSGWSTKHSRKESTMNTNSWHRLRGTSVVGAAFLLVMLALPGHAQPSESRATADDDSIRPFHIHVPES